MKERAGQKRPRPRFQKNAGKEKIKLDLGEALC